MTGIPLIIAFVVAIALMILLISKLRVHAFLSIMLVSLLFAFAAGIPQKDIPGVIGDGFSGTFRSIGIVIILGALVGTLLEKTGAALKMADSVVRVVGKKNPEAALIIMGWIVSIPVFCDSGFVILNPIRKALVKRTGRSSVAASVALSMGLYISHCFIPPTPGPIAAANTLFEQGLAGTETNLLLVMGVGAAASILPLIFGFLYALFIGKRVKAGDESNMPAADGEVVLTYEQLVASYGKLPSGLLSFSPIVVPILLMALASIFSMAKLSVPIVSFLGTPIMALAVGVLLGIFLLWQSGKMKDFYKITDDSLRVTGPILFVTAAGGVLGRVIATSALVPYIQENATALSSLGLLFPFLLAAILKTAQGSSTVAITTSAGIIAPLLATLGLATPIGAALVTIAIGAGAMTVSHANDSYFWVVTNFGSMTPENGYKTQTLGTLVIGLAAMLNVWIISLII